MNPWVWAALVLLALLLWIALVAAVSRVAEALGRIAAGLIVLGEATIKVRAQIDTDTTISRDYAFRDAMANSPVPCDCGATDIRGLTSSHQPWCARVKAAHRREP